MNFLLALLATAQVHAADCTRYCNPETSKPCGKSCISKEHTCHKEVTTTCSGVNPKKKASK